MLQEIRFKNFLSFRDETIFSFEPSKEDPINRVVTMSDGTKLLRFAVIFGANASGKSNFLQALEFLLQFWTQLPSRNDLTTRVTPFLLDKETPRLDSIFEVKFFIDDIRYWYKLELNSERVSSESLFFYESNRPTRIFWREYTDGKSVIKFNPAVENLKAAEIDAININCWKNMSLFASMAKVNIQIESIDKVIHWINKKLMPGINRSTELSDYAKNKMLKEESFREYLMSFTRHADLRISRIDVKEMPISLNERQLKVISEASFIDEKQRAEILSKGFINDIQSDFVVHVKNAHGEENEFILPESSQSAGTTRVIEIEAAIHTILENQAFLAIDEIEASLHPYLLDFILDRFLKEENNESQLLVTTHYDPLLDAIDDLFGKDSVWFTEKKEDGNTDLYPLTDFKGLNKLPSIHKSYKSGRFGAVPEIYV